MTSARDLAANELAPIAEFLRQTLPFNELSPDELDAAVTSLRVTYHCRGESFDRDVSEQGLRILRLGMRGGCKEQ